ncbi:helix-turn-helix domain-containing protein [Kaistia dalseonensis]|uniref:DNA-binding HxlR family transcriptional regulator n=1 Tax=Kaistia dalseonensis TaxID=410840 RepID=A0ABU0HDA2_9HYPH|nr:helix-turn-helix domain-containing protein [Kaistia dalseonensis]MCX5497640.1 helix-turn-helix domain-containing protein [Kaistia dalseonensis]MDQ0440282.1 DNA-binding HxlR family transcriptional regulator [Kaistia dalseonensis]
MIYTHLMVTIVERPQEPSEFCASMSEAEDNRARELLERVSAKWPLGVLQVLAEAGAPLRFSRLMERVDGISQKMLTQTLRMLEADRLVTRTLYPQVPPRVDYELTPLGRELLLQILPFWRWIVQNLPAFDADETTKAAE